MKYLPLLLLFPALALSQDTPLLKEADYVEHFCKGQMEYKLWDGTRVDCLTETEAQEFDWGRKSYEAIGQALWYAMNTGTQASVVLIVSDKHMARDEAGISRAEKIIAHYGLPIKLGVIRKKDE